MKQHQIKIGHTYAAKVTGKVVPVRIDAEHPNGGWDATNIHTHRKVRIKSAQRLRGRITVPDREPIDADGIKAIHKADQENARLADQRAKAADGQIASERAMAKSATRAGNPAKANHDATPAPHRDTGERGANGGQRGAKPMSLLDAAAHLLSLGTGDPMRVKDIVDLAVARGLWMPRDGKTPANTLYAAIAREITTKGDASRFAKVGRGRFALASTH